MHVCVTVDVQNWRMSTHTKYVGEGSNIVLQSRTFGLLPTYVDNHRYTLVEVENRGAHKEATGCFPPNPLFCWKSVSLVSLMQGLMDFVLLTVEVGESENSVSFWDWESDALLGRVQLNEEHLTGGLFHPREPDLAVTFGMHHLAFWRRKKDGFLTRIDALAPVCNI
ncbi:echinoderm microtubule-associated protein-like CG42247 [Trichonephila clavipes]|nr:echinoderm microtubule-associated protein-like CG42247 [Trichonephila clavipes]